MGNMITVIFFSSPVREDRILIVSVRVNVFPERGAKPVTNFMRNLSALSSWHSVYTSAIAFIVSSQPFSENEKQHTHH